MPQLKPSQVVSTPWSRPSPQTPRPAMLATAALLGCAALLWCGRALACSCSVLTPAEAYEQADAVFEGRVVEVRAPAADAAAHASSRSVHLQVVRAWKGIAGEQVEVTTAVGGTACGYDFAAERSYFVYAANRDGKLAVSLCSRTRPMADAAEDLHVLGMGATPVDPHPASETPKQAEPRQPPARGGCASCAVGAGGGPPAHALRLALCALAALTWRKRSRSRP
jgi:hypothetical protein